MICLKRTILSLFASSLLLCLSYVVQGADKTIWKGSIGDLNVRWTKADITATQSGEVLFSAQALAEQIFEADFLADKSLLEDDNECEYRRTFTLLSLVGNIASFKETEYVNCQSMPHPSIETQFVGRDLSQSGKMVKLTDFFAESDIVKAIITDPLIKKALAQTDSKMPATLTALYDALEWAAITVKECEYQFPANFLSQFALHHVNRNKVAVRLSLQPIFPACQSSNAQLGFYISIPSQMERAFKQAQKGKMGFLMTRYRKIAGKNNTETAFFTASTMTVQQGDTLSGIAKYYGRSTAELAAWNNLKTPYKLLVGQVLSINPPPTVKSLAPVTTVKKMLEYTPVYHNVVAGETLYGVAKRYGYNMREIAAWNNIKAPYHLLIGQRLQVSKPVQLETSEGVTKTLKKVAFKKKLQPKQRIITVSGANVRAKPKLSANRVGKLPFGMIVKELTRSDTQYKIGSSKDYWYQVEMTEGKTGWMFGTLSDPFELAQRAKIYQQIAQTRLQKQLSWNGQMELTDFLARAKDEVSAHPEIAAELALSYLLSLQKMTNQIHLENQKTPPYNTWLKKQPKNLIYLDEIQGAWHINSEVFWNLHEKYYPLPIADRIAWAAAKNPLGGECEGIFECNLRRMADTMVKYLKFHPNGQSVENALEQIAKFVDTYKKEGLDTANKNVDVPRLLAVLRVTVERVNHSKKDSILSQMNKL